VQRLRSHFLSGPTGLGLLILRLVLGGFLAAAGSRALVDRDALSAANGTVIAIAAVLVIVCAVLIGIGLLTPFIQTIVVVIKVAALLWPVEMVTMMSDPWQVRVFEVAIAASLALTGPGAYSIDAISFGRREINIPSRVRPLDN
jgi:putative oxidoreductase